MVQVVETCLASIRPQKKKKVNIKLGASGSFL
jgi:hypothetical protein